MKTALFVPFIPDENTTPSLGPLYLLGLLEKNDIEGFLFDERIDPKALDKLLAYKPDIVGVSAVTPAYLRGLGAVKEIKTSLPNVKIAFGGAHPSILPDSVIKEPAVDYVFTGESEFPFLELCRKIKENNISKESLSQVNNLYFKNGTEIVQTSRQPFLEDKDLDKLPFPAFHKMDLALYFSNTQTHGLFKKGKRILPVMTTRGCPSTCTFCCRVMGRKIRCRSVDNVMSEINYLIKQYKVDEIYFEDDNFTVLRNRALEILDRMTAIKPPVYLKFANGIRADLVDAEILKTMKKAGVYSLSFGIESGSKNTLAKMKKGLNLEKARENILLAKSLGFLVGSNCIIGYPEETIEDIKESINFFLKLPLDSMAIVNLVPFPGTEARAVCEEKGYLTDKALNWDNYYFSINNPIPLIKTPMLPENKLVSIIHKAYNRMYFRPSWIIRSIKHLSVSQIVRGIKILIFNKGKK
ncbi:MAG: B12-binding domain-containing radical SAM protein [Elusimicrobia bacterium]|nr:B12-binding domain-containing radical SAM protein [Elusimicrobiota bacterium]